MKLLQDKVKTRVLSKKDLNLLPQIELIESRSQKNPWNTQSCRECFYEPYCLIGLFVAGKIQGFSVIYNTAVSTDLLTIGIDPAWQSRGLGALLLEATLREALNCRANECFLEVRVSNVRAQKLYEKFGFERTGIRKGYYRGENGEKPEDAITMHLPDIRQILYASNVQKTT